MGTAPPTSPAFLLKSEMWQRPKVCKDLPPQAFTTLAGQGPFLLDPSAPFHTCPPTQFCPPATREGTWAKAAVPRKPRGLEEMTVLLSLGTCPFDSIPFSSSHRHVAYLLVNMLVNALYVKKKKHIFGRSSSLTKAELERAGSPWQ